MLIDYVCRVTGGKLLPGDDVCAVDWVRRRDLAALQITEGTLAVIEKAFVTRREYKYGATQSHEPAQRSRTANSKSTSAQLVGALRRPARWAGASWIRCSRITIASAWTPTSPRPARPSVPAARRRARSPHARGAAIRVDFGGLPDTEAAVQKLRIEGAGLEPKEIFDLFALLDRAADAKIVLTAAAERFPRLGARAATIGDFRALLENSTARSSPTAAWPITPASR